MLCAINKSPCNDYCIDLDNTNLFLVFILFRQMTMTMMMMMSTKPPTPVLNPMVNWSPSDSLVNSLATINSTFYSCLTLWNTKQSLDNKAFNKTVVLTKTYIFRIVIILLFKVDIAKFISLTIKCVKFFNITFTAYVRKIPWSLKYFLPATLHFQSKLCHRWVMVNSIPCMLFHRIHQSYVNSLMSVRR